MKRFFDLEGERNVSDSGGLIFPDELDALRAALRLAKELADSRPDLKGKASIVVTSKDERKCCQVPIWRSSINSISLFR